VRSQEGTARAGDMEFLLFTLQHLLISGRKPEHAGCVRSQEGTARAGDMEFLLFTLQHLLEY
jgi:hypothetical protein